MCEKALSRDALVGVVEDVETAIGVVDVSGEKRWLAPEVRGDQLAAFVVDATRGGAGDVHAGGVGVGRAVGEKFLR